VGLYIAVFQGDEELEGVEVGSYQDFGDFRDAVCTIVENGDLGSVCPTLMLHEDSDGSWEPDEARMLLAELDVIERVFQSQAPIELNSQWKQEVADELGLKPSNLLQCFFDVDGISLVSRLRQIAALAVARGVPILFQ